MAYPPIGLQKIIRAEPPVKKSEYRNSTQTNSQIELKLGKSKTPGVCFALRASDSAAKLFALDALGAFL